MTKNQQLLEWVKEAEDLCKPSFVHWCDGSVEEYERALVEAVMSGAAIRLNQQKRPGCYLFRSHPSDVARVEKRTFIASKRKEDAGPSNNWINPEELRKTMRGLYAGCMEGRTMYIIPFSMGPVGAPASKIGVEITDSPYVVASMHIMARIGTPVLEALGDGEFVRCLHSVGVPLKEGQKDAAWPCASMEEKYISHFPESRTIWSYGSGYGGNALLGKKCFALRIASVQARDEGWLAEHMLIMGLTNPEGKTAYIAGAFPSACGKTNLAMIVPTLPGWKTETIGDDIAWMHPGKDGRLYAINPEHGFFGVAPGTSYQSNPNAMRTIEKNTIFTNVALTDDGDVWWEGIGTPPPAHLIDWEGNDWSPGCGRPASHPNARYTAPLNQCPSIALDLEHPDGVPISAILVGGRRPAAIPLVYESFSWEHGIFMGLIMGSEMTAATISDSIGKVRRDPFAMLPFVGYHLCDYLKHWLDIGEMMEKEKAPLIFNVNWFRKSAGGAWLWPGFGENIRVLKWVVERVLSGADAIKTEIGYLPVPGSIDRTGLDSVSDEDMETLLQVDRQEWLQEAEQIKAHFDSFGPAMPKALRVQLDGLLFRLNASPEQ